MNFCCCVVNQKYVCVNKAKSSGICCSGRWHVGINSAYVSKCIFVCSSLSKAPSSSLAFLWAPHSSHDGVAGEVGDAAEVATVTCHQDVAVLAPALAPAVGERQKMTTGKERKRRESCWASPGVKQHLSSSVCHQHGRQKASNQRYANKQPVVSFWRPYEPPDAIQTGDVTHLFLMIQYFFPLELCPKPTASTAWLMSSLLQFGS